MIKEIIMSGKPHLTKEDLLNHSLISVCGIFDKSFDAGRKTRCILVSYKWSPIERRMTEVSHVYSTDNFSNYSEIVSFVKNIFKNNPWAVETEPLNLMGLEDMIDYESNDLWNHPRLNQLAFVLTDGGNTIVKTFYKKPVGLESKKMCHKKSQTKKSPVKRMTGNIEVLGKNFNKLI